MIRLSLLGCGGSLPVPQRFLTSLLVDFNGSKTLVDCGEGTQVSLRLLGWGFKSIDTICFTHAHADHVAGLPGLLLTIGNSGRTEPLTIIGPMGFKRIVEGLRVICPYLPYDLYIIEMPMDNQWSLDMKGLQISALPVDHTEPCLAYSFNVRRGGKFDVNKAKDNNVPIHLWKTLQNTDSLEYEGRVYTSSMVLGNERKGIKVSYCTDTRPFEGLNEFVHGSDLLIAEGMYGDDSDREKAIINKHMIFSEAAQLAKDSGSRELWLTHFSPSMDNPEEYFQNASGIFPKTTLGYDRISTEMNFIN